MINPTQVNIPFESTEELSCDICENPYFVQGLYIRKASGLLTGTGTPALIPIPVFLCSKCGHVNEEFLPKQVREEGDGEEEE